jgi:membrane protein implicated in regulation of membrane protease activity
MRVVAFIIAFLMGTAAWIGLAYFGLLAWTGGSDYMAPVAALLFVWPISVPLFLLSPLGGFIAMGILQLLTGRAAKPQIEEKDENAV